MTSLRHKDPNDNRPGYKKTKVGWIPEEWNAVRFKALSHMMANGFVGKVKEHYCGNGDGVPYVQGYNVKANRIDYTGMCCVTSVFHSRQSKTALKTNDILTIQTGEIGISVLVPPNLDGANCHALIISRLRHEVAMPAFFIQYLNSELGLSRLWRISTGSILKHINATDLHIWEVPTPPLPEQKKIAEILSTWDEAIEQARKLIEARKRRKKGLMQQLLTGQKRLPGFRGKWDRPRTSEVFSRVSRRSCGDESVLSATQDKGIVERGSLDKRIEYNRENLNNYKLIEPGDFVISLRSFQGGLELSQIKGRVSPAYHVIRGGANIEAEFFRYYFKSPNFIGHLAIAVIGIRDGKQVSYDDFSFMRVPLPPLLEQKAIAAILQAADEEITNLESRLAALETQKRGLMQKLLTGAVRVKAK